MNIFFVDIDPNEAAKALYDKHVVKMILESAQLLSTAHRVLDGNEYREDGKKKFGRLDDGREELFYKITHKNHPCAKWCRESVENYNWLVEHMYGLLREYQLRYGKSHKVLTSGLAYMLQSPPYNLKEWDFTTPPLAMPEEFKIKDSFVGSYRKYYREGKEHLKAYTNQDPPYWL